MKKKWLSLILLSVLLISGYFPIASCHNAPFPGSYDPTHAVIDSISEPETVDPAWCYDTASAGLIFNVYETMIFFDTVYTDGPYNTGKTDVFKPQLATDIAMLPGPTVYAKTFYFKIRGSGTTSTFVTTGVEDAVDLFKDGQIYGRYFVRDPDYGVVNNAQGPIKPAQETPSVDGVVDRASVPARASSGQIINIVDSTWIRQDGPTDTRGCVIRGVDDLNSDGVLNAGDRFGVVRKCYNPTIGPWWNVREYWTVQSVSSTSPYTVTAIPVQVLFHNGAALTPADVEYSWERWMVQDRSGGPAWMWYYPMLGLYRADDPATDPNFGLWIDNAIGSNATHAWVSLAIDFPAASFLQILCQSCASIVNKDWCIAKGDFDGNFVGHTWQYIWDTWHNPQLSFIEGDMMGTGPFKFSYWEQGTAYSVEKYDGYWDGWPAYVSPTGTQRLPSFLTRVTWNLVTDWTTRRARFLAGDVDFASVPRVYRDQILGQIVGGERIRCFYPFNVPALDAFFFNFNINPQSQYLGPGFDPANPYAIGPDRIPVNLFSDINVRLGFAYAFNYLQYLSLSYLGEGTQPADPVIKGLTYDRPTNIEDETWEKHNELAPANGVFDAGESIYFDADNSFTVTAGDTLEQGPALPVGTPLVSFGIVLTNDEKHAENIAQDGWFNTGESIYRDLDHDGTVSTAGDIYLVGTIPPIGSALKVTEKFADANNNDEWDVGEPAIRDNNGDMVYDISDTLLAGTPLKTPNDSEKYADINKNDEWDVGEPAIRDNNGNGVYDMGDTVLAGNPPSSNTPLKTPDDFEKFADLNGNNEWDAQEAAIRDNLNDGAYDISDTILAGNVPAMSAMLKVPDDYEKFADNIVSNGAWDVGEPAIRDNNNDKVYDTGDTVLSGATPFGGEDLLVSLEKFADSIVNNNDWDFGEPAIRDENCDGVFDADDTVVSGIPPAIGTALRTPDDYEKFADTNGNNEWDYGEAAIRDNNNDNVYGDIFIQGPVQPQGTALVSFVGKWKYVYNPSLAKIHLSSAWSGQLWANGMHFTLCYNSGNVARETAVTMLKNNIEGLNSLFTLDVQEIAYASTYLPQMVARMLPLFTNGWTADFTHPHDFVHPFMHSQGTFASCQSYSNPTVDSLIAQGIDPTNPNPAGTYATLQETYHTDVPSVPLVQPVGRQWEQAWVRGWYYNPLYGGCLTQGVDSTGTDAQMIYFYHIWKAFTHFGDANNDGTVGVSDGGTVSASWTKPTPTSPLGPLGYRPQADINGGTAATTGSDSGIVIGIPDGKVDTADAALVSAYWDGPPLGPAHP